MVNLNLTSVKRKKSQEPNVAEFYSANPNSGFAVSLTFSFSADGSLDWDQGHLPTNGSCSTTELTWFKAIDIAPHVLSGKNKSKTLSGFLGFAIYGNLDSHKSCYCYYVLY